MVTNFSQFLQQAKDCTVHKRIVLACAEDKHALDAVYRATKKGVVSGILVGNQDEIFRIAKESGFDLNPFQIIHCKTKKEAVKTSVKIVAEGSAEILMKGAIGTADLLRAVLNDQWGLKTGSLLSHMAVFELPHYHKLLAITDAAMNIAPDIKEKVGIVKNSVTYLNKIGITAPKVAILAAVELVNEKMPATIDAAILSKMADRGQIKNCIIDGPLAFDNAISKESAMHKGIKSEVAGDADLLVVPSIETGNILYKAMAFGGANPAAILLGAKVPIVLTSRADSEETKLNSIILAAVS